MTGDDVRGEEPRSQRQVAAMHHSAGRHGCLPRATGAFPSCAISLQRPALAGTTGGADEALGPTMLRQIMRARFLVGKPSVERLAGHRFVVFPSGWHKRNNTRTLQVSKPRRTTSCTAGSKEISLFTIIVPFSKFHNEHTKGLSNLQHNCADPMPPQTVVSGSSSQNPTKTPMS
jgi:hypothetical protein